MASGLGIEFAKAEARVVSPEAAFERGLNIKSSGRVSIGIEFR